MWLLKRTTWVRARTVAVALAAVVASVGAVFWFVPRDSEENGIVTCASPAQCAEELAESGTRPLVPDVDDRFTFMFGDISRSDERPKGTMVLHYQTGLDQTLEMLVTDTTQSGVAQKPDDSELVTTPGGRRVRATDRFVSHWDGTYLYTIISPSQPNLPEEAITLIDLLR